MIVFIFCFGVANLFCCSIPVGFAGSDIAPEVISDGRSRRTNRNARHKIHRGKLDQGFKVENFHGVISL